MSVKKVSSYQIAMGVVKCLRLRYLINFLLLFSLMTPLGGQAQELCSSVLLSRPTKSDLFADLNTNSVESMDAPLWQSYVDGIQTPAEYSAFVREMQVLAIKRVAPKNKYGSVSDYRGDVGIVYRLQALDFIGPVVRFRDQMTLEQKNTLMKDFETVHRYGMDQSLESHRRWGALQSAFRLALFPETLPDFIKNTSSDVDYGASGVNFAFGPSVRIALASVPAKMKQEARNVLTQELQKEFSAAKNGEGKRRRRNLETIHYYLSAKNLLSIAQDLDGKTVRETVLVEWIDQHWAPIVTAPMPKGVGEYSFKAVLDIAKIVQQKMAGQFSGSYIELYGSFPNMKAHLATSDVDVHLGDTLMLKYLEAFSENRNFADPKNIRTKGGEAPQQAQSLANDLVKTESAIAKFLGRTEYKPSELMTLVPISPKSFNKFYEPRKYQFYNALKVVVYEDKIVVQVYDLFQSSMYSIQLAREGIE